MGHLGWWLLQSFWLGLIALGVYAGLADGNLTWRGNALIWIGVFLGAFLNLIFAANRPRLFDPLQPTLLPRG